MAEDIGFCISEAAPKVQLGLPWMRMLVGRRQTGDLRSGPLAQLNLDHHNDGPNRQRDPEKARRTFQNLAKCYPLSLFSAISMTLTLVAFTMDLDIREAT